LQVRAQYKYCSSSTYGTGPTCNCAVAVKSGDDVITFSGCAYYEAYQQPLPKGPTQITVKVYKNGELTPGTRIRRLGCGQKYEVNTFVKHYIRIFSTFFFLH